ncbi:MAG TPA: hypothetical protein VFZ61_30820 [Polyangiales bacterium]
MGSTELGVGIVLVCVSVAVAALWGSDRDVAPGSGTTAAAEAPASDASAASVADNSAPP